MSLSSIVAIALAVLAVLYLGVAFLFCLFAVNRKPIGLMKRKNKPYEDEMDAVAPQLEWWNSQTKEEWKLTSFDGLRLFAEFLPAENAKATIVQMHGYHSISTYEFSMEYRALHNEGYNILLPHQRAHGKSEGRWISFGVNEGKDVRAWVEEVARRTGNLPIIIEGVSMGGTSVIMAAEEKLPGTVKCIIDDCGFTSPAAIISEVSRNSFHIPPRFFIGAICMWMRLLTHSDPRRSTVDVLKKNTLPVLFIHGEADTFVPYRMGRENFRACVAEKKFVSVPLAKHARSSVVAPDKVNGEIIAFIKSR